MNEYNLKNYTKLFRKFKLWYEIKEDKSGYTYTAILKNNKHEFKRVIETTDKYLRFGLLQHEHFMGKLLVRLFQDVVEWKEKQPKSLFDKFLNFINEIFAKIKSAYKARRKYNLW